MLINFRKTEPLGLLLSPDEISDLYRLGGMEINSGQTENMKNDLLGMWSFDGQERQGLYFDGNNDKISLPTLDVGTVHSASVWLDWQDTVDGVIIARPLGTAGDNSGYLIYIDTTYIYYNNGGLSGSDWVRVAHGGLTSGQWNNLAVVRNGTSVKFYKNGSQLGTTQTLQSNTALTDIAAIGSYGSGTFPSKMILDEVRIYNRALTPTEVGDLYRMGVATMER